MGKLNITIKYTLKITLLLLASAGLSAGAGIPQAVQSEVNQRIEHQLNPSIVIGLYENGESNYYVKGFQNLVTQKPANIQTVYEIGSITKTFTGLLLAQMVQENQLQLDDPIQDYWPQPFSLVDGDKQAITFKQLSTHSSGLPRLPSNLSVFSQDPNADYDRQQLLAAVNQLELQKTAINYAYSNFAVGLLGETLATLTQSTYNDLITTKVLKPLKLNQTYMLLDQVPKPLLAQGYRGAAAVDPWQFQALAGAGSIRSSIEDLLAYGVAHLKPEQHDLTAAMQLATTPHFQQDSLRVGLGWHINQAGLIWHNGGTAGFRSIIMIDPIKQQVAAGITNSTNNLEDMVLHLMDPSKPMVDHEFPVAIETAQLNQFTATFKHPESGKRITIIKPQQHLFFTADKQPQQRMTYIGDDTFKLKTFKVKLAFKRDDKNQVSALDLIGWGDPQTYQKITVD